MGRLRTHLRALLIASGVLVALLLIGASASAAHRSAAAAPRDDPPAQPNIVFILSDDQRYDELGHMPNVLSQIQDKGVTFDNSFVTNSLCCPSRTTMLTGLYSHTTDVYYNKPPHGGFPTFHAGPYEQDTVALWLHNAGYRTALIGKYLNAYKKRFVDFVPAGWDDWYTWLGNASGYRAAQVSDNGVFLKTSGYSATVFANRADSFIRSTPAGQPLFLILAQHAPHDPATPDTKYANACADLQPYRPPNYGINGPNEPKWVRKLTWDATKQADQDALNLNRCRSLLSVDDSVGQMVTALQDTGRLSNTLLVYASDNGMMTGAHAYGAKRVPWNESIRVPLMMRWDGHIAPGSHASGLAVNVDWAETFADAGGATMPSNVEGQSLFDLLDGAPWRSDFLIESYSPGWTPLKRAMPNYCGVRSADWLYVKYATGEEQLYDENADPYELHNLAADPASASQLAAMRARNVQLCSPPPPGYTP